MSEVFVLLLTENVLTRPWCLLELHEAARRNKPIVMLSLKGKRFDFDDAFELLSDLEGNLPSLNPHALDELRSHLEGATLSELAQSVKQALEADVFGRARAGSVPTLNLSSTSNQLEAQLVDLVGEMTTAGRPQLEWSQRLIEPTRQLPEAREGDRSARLRARRKGACAAATGGAADDARAGVQPGGAGSRRGRRHRAGPRGGLARELSDNAPDTRSARSAVDMARPYQAHLACLPLVCVLVEGSGYDFDAARQRLRSLEAQMDASALDEMREVLACLSPPTEISTLQAVLEEVLLSLISVSFHPSGTDKSLPPRRAT